MNFFIKSNYFKYFLYSLIFIFCIKINIFADLFYSRAQYNNIYNEKVAVELEIKKVTRQLKNTKNNLEAKNSQLQSEIDSLNKKLSNLKKQSEQDNADYASRLKELEKRTDLLKEKGSNLEKNLISENRELQKRYEAEIKKLKNQLKDERAENVKEQKDLQSKYETMLSDLNKKLSNLTEELSELKNLNKKQKNELSRLSKQADELEKKLESEIKDGQIRLKRFHDKLIINLDDTISFDSGSAKLKPKIKLALKKITEILSNYPENNIVIEGHTDNVPIHSKKFRNNWQLSTERALSVLGYILKNKKLKAERFSAAGNGEFQPIVPNDTKANKALNRRVDIVVRPRVKSK